MNLDFSPGEQRFPTMTSGVWFALFVSDKIPAPIAAKLRTASMQAVSAVEVKDKLASIGAESWSGSAQDFVTYEQQDTARFAEDIKRLGITPQD